VPFISEIKGTYLLGGILPVLKKRDKKNGTPSSQRRFSTLAEVRGPVIIPEVSIDEYELMFDTSFIGFTLQLLDENCEEVYCTIITSSTVILPSTLSGEYEILLLPDTGSIYFFGTITL